MWLLNTSASRIGYMSTPSQ